MIECLLLLITFIIGYSLGKRTGRKDGFAEAEATIPLRLRQNSYEIGKCILCQTEPGKSAGCS